jgi:hypothetical protein
LHPGRASVQYQGLYGLHTLFSTLHIPICDRVVSLHLDDPMYTDATVESICQLKYLESISIARTSITEQGLERLSRTLPDCQITILKQN